MILTEKEAAEKWCPQARLESSPSPTCIGSHCMMWEWVVSDQEAFQRSHDRDGTCGLINRSAP